MILKALITQLQTGSITAVYPRGNMETYPSGKDTNELLTTYVLVYADFAVNAYYTTDNTVAPYIIEVHFPAGFIDQLDAYIENEIIALLNRKRLTDSDGNVFQVFVTENISIMSEPNDDRSISGGNDDKTISKYRRIFVPRRGA